MKPIGQLLRERSADNRSGRGDAKNLVSIEDQIKALEQELDSDDNSDSVSDDDDDNSINDGSSVGDDGKEVLVDLEVDETGKIVKMGTKLSEDDRIKPLPKEQLPLPMYSKILKNAGLTPEDRKKRKTSIRFADELPPERSSEAAAAGSGKRPKNATTTGISTTTTPGTSGDDDQQQGLQKKGDRDTNNKLAGLEATIREQLANYRPASRDKLPLFCRCCSHQSANLEAFEAHKKSAEHVIAVNIEKKVSFCKLCRKQFTSPDQLKDHLDGKAHKERLENVKQKQQSSRKFC